MFAGLARRIPQFSSRYASDREADLYGAILLFLLLAAAVLITVMDRKVRICWQKTFAAMALIKDFPQLHLPKQQQEEKQLFGDEYVNTWVWLLFYWVIMAMLFAIECVLSVIALGGILEVVT